MNQWFLQGEDGRIDAQSDDKKSRKPTSSGRPYLLRRSTASGAGGSIKRRSFRFKKGTNKESGKEGGDARKASSKDSADGKKGGLKEAFKDKFGDSRKSGHKDDDHKRTGCRDGDIDRKYSTYFLFYLFFLYESILGFSSCGLITTSWALSRSYLNSY